MSAILSSYVYGLSWTQQSFTMAMAFEMSNHNAKSKSDGLRFNWLGN